MATRISKHFTLEEMTTSAQLSRLTSAELAAQRNPPAAVLAAMVTLCCRVLEPIRELYGPVRILSGYRSLPLNRIVGGASGSQHTTGEAADFQLMNPVSLYAPARTIALDLEYDQLILEFIPAGGRGGWLHATYSLAGPQRRAVLEASRGTAGATRYHRISADQIPKS
jgi:zinc D-Ala-D-Ala carboxypeptidase